MTETSEHTARQGGQTPLVIAALVGAVLVGGAFLFSTGGERALMNSATGFNGLVAWLKANQVEARAFNGGGRLAPGEVGLRILPLYDTDLTAERTYPRTREDVIRQTTERDITEFIVKRKTAELPTLVILPKWRTGMRHLGVVHQDLLIPEAEMNRLLRQLGAGGEVSRDPDGWRRYAAPSGEIGLAHAQAIRATACTPLISSPSGILLGRCPIPPDHAGYGQAFYWILTDPDILNNHGLQWAANGEVISYLLVELLATKPVILDLTDRLYMATNRLQASQRERSWADLARMFGWPFSMIWLAFGVLAILSGWRSVIRDRPLARAHDDEPRASKEVSIDAKARLLRLANHDAALLGNHISARLRNLAAEILGPYHADREPPLDALTRRVHRRDPALALALAEVATPPPEAALTESELLSHLDRFETCYDKVIYEFGRPQRPG